MTRDRAYWGRLWAREGTPFVRSEPERPFWKSEMELAELKSGRRGWRFW